MLTLSNHGATAQTLRLAGDFTGKGLVVSPATGKVGLTDQAQPAGDPLFDRRHYLAHDPDVKAAAIDLLLHYVQYGQAEGRAAFNA